MITYENKEFYTVFEINDYIKALFDNTLTLSNIGLIGEVSNFKGATRSGHLYFSLKDEKSIINCIMFKFDTFNLDFEFKDGDMVLVIGNITSYVANGNYQIIVKRMIPYGEGNILLKKEKLKQQLYKEGLFDESRKLKIPYFPKVISIICGQNSAAEKDFLFNLTRRNPLIKLNFIYSKVQGNDSLKDLINALDIASNDNSDLIILGRGGGAKEDLNVFDEEELVRKVASLKKPIISAIGHEINLSLVDLASSKHVSTPTQACEEAVIDIEDLIKELSYIKSNIYRIMINKINNYEKEILKFKSLKFLTNYNEYLNNYLNSLNKLKINLNNYVSNIIYKKENDIKDLEIKLSSLDVINILNKGYNLMYKDNKLVLELNSLNINDEVKIKTKDGIVKANIKEIIKEK